MWKGVIPGVLRLRSLIKKFDIKIKKLRSRTDFIMFCYIIQIIICFSSVNFRHTYCRWTVNGLVIVRIFLCCKCSFNWAEIYCKFKQQKIKLQPGKLRDLVGNLNDKPAKLSMMTFAPLLYPLFSLRTNVCAEFASSGQSIYLFTVPDEMWACTDSPGEPYIVGPCHTHSCPLLGLIGT